MPSAGGKRQVQPARLVQGRNRAGQGAGVGVPATCTLGVHSIANAGRELEIADAALIRNTKIKDRAVRPGGRKREARKFGGIIADLAAARTGVSVEHIAPVQFSKAVLARASSRFVATPRSETL